MRLSEGGRAMEMPATVHLHSLQFSCTTHVFHIECPLGVSVPNAILLPLSLISRGYGVATQSQATAPCASHGCPILIISGFFLY